MNELISLFIISLLSSTLLPGGSEAYLIWLLKSTDTLSFILLMIATIGNTIGGFINWLIGYFINTSIIKRFKVNHKLQNKKSELAKKWVKKWGYYILLFSWLPVIGDLLCLFAGIYQLNAYKSIIAIFTGKLIRYAVIIYLIADIINPV